MIRFVFRIKAKCYLGETKKLRCDSHDTRTGFSTSSAKLKLIETKAKAAALEVKAKFLKEKQTLRITSVELELRQQISEAKAEEKIYEQFDEEQIIHGMNDYLKDVTANLTSIPILFEAQPNGQCTLKVPSVKF